MSGLDSNEQDLADRITGYLRRNPNATDTVEGIAEWWLSSEPGPRTVEDVERVLLRLVSSGLIERRLKPDREWIYGLARARRARNLADREEGS